MLYTAIFEQLHHAEVRYLLCGGFAVNLYGIPRMTADVDVLLDFTPENIVRFEAAMIAIAYKPHLPLSLSQLSDEMERISLVKERNLIAYSYVGQDAGSLTLDVLVDMPFSFEELWTRRETRPISQIPVQMVSVNDLIALKEYSGRTQDRQDIVNLQKLYHNL